MVHYKLYYFNGRGIAESIRLLFTYTKQPFEDFRINHEDWNAWTEQKSKFFYGKLPVLEIDGGKHLAQSTAILRYLAIKFDENLCGKDEWEKAKVNEIMDFQKDVHNTLIPYIFVKKGYKEGDLEKMRAEFNTNSANFFSLYVKLLKESGSGFLLPSGLTIADFVVVEYLDTMRISEPEAVNKFPELVEYIARIYALPQLKEYVEKRTHPGW